MDSGILVHLSSSPCALVIYDGGSTTLQTTRSIELALVWQRRGRRARLEVNFQRLARSLVQFGLEPGRLFGASDLPSR
jgi:hypothetical protein